MALYTAFLNSIKLSSCRTGIKADKEPLAVEQNTYLTKIVNIYIVYDLDPWPKVPLRNFTLKNYLLGAASVVKISDKERYVQSGYGIAFDGNGERSFDNEYARNVTIFGVGHHLMLTIARMTF